MPRCKWHRDWDRHTAEMMRLVNEVGLSPDHPAVRRARLRSVGALAFAAHDDERDGGQNDYCFFETADERAARLKPDNREGVDRGQH